LPVDPITLATTTYTTYKIKNYEHFYYKLPLPPEKRQTTSTGVVTPRLKTTGLARCFCFNRLSNITGQALKQVAIDSLDVI